MPTFSARAPQLASVPRGAKIRGWHERTGSMGRTNFRSWHEVNQFLGRVLGQLLTQSGHPAGAPRTSRKKTYSLNSPRPLLSSKHLIFGGCCCSGSPSRDTSRAIALWEVTRISATTNWAKSLDNVVFTKLKNLVPTNEPWPSATQSYVYIA